MENFLFFSSIFLMMALVSAFIVIIITCLESFYFNFKSMKCPHCNKVLLKSLDTRKFETLVEHVSPSGEELPERHYFKCFNEKCFVSDKLFWDEWGDYYCEKDISRDFIQWLGEQKNNDNSMSAKNSGASKIDESLKKYKENYDEFSGKRRWLAGRLIVVLTYFFSFFLHSR